MLWLVARRSLWRCSTSLGVGGRGDAAIAHFMFSPPHFLCSDHARTGSAQIFSEFVAAFGLMAMIWGCSRPLGAKLEKIIVAVHAAIPSS